jgi:hypothetical protein
MDIDNIIEHFENLLYFESTDEAQWALVQERASNAIEELKKYKNSSKEINSNKGAREYTEEDLREAFYKGREQAKLPDEKGTTLFIRPTFNGYLRELRGQECPYSNWKIRIASLINDKDYDLEEWKAHNLLRKIQQKELNNK